jgi:hypothetical protein
VSRPIRTALVLGLAAALLAGCTAGPPRPRPALRLTDIVDAPSPVAHWRYQTAMLASEFLMRQGSAMSLAEPGRNPRLLPALTAAVALDGPGGAEDARAADDVRAAYDPATGLFAAEAVEPLFVTWLVVRWSFTGKARRPLPAPDATLSAAIGARLAGLREPAARGDTGAAGAYLLGLRSLEILGAASAAPPPGDPCSSAHRTAAAADLAGTALWLEIAARTRGACPAATSEAVAGIARDLLADHANPTVDAVTGLDAAATVLSLRGDPVPEAALCRALGDERGDSGLLPHRLPILYLVCRDIARTSGRPLALSDPVVRSLRLQVRLRGALAEQQSTNALGLLYATGGLRSLGFRRDIVQAVAGGPRLADDPVRDPVLMAFVAGDVRADARTQATLAAPLASDPTLRSAAALAAVVLAAGGCAPEAADRLGRDWTRSASVGADGVAAASSADLGELQRRALIVAARLRCDPADPGGRLAADRAELLAAVQGGRRPDGLFGSPANVLPTWQGQEALCLLTGRPDLSASALTTILPQWTVDQPGFLFPKSTFYASVRLTDMVETGCSGAWWDTTANGR